MRNDSKAQTSRNVYTLNENPNNLGFSSCAKNSLFMQMKKTPKLWNRKTSQAPEVQRNWAKHANIYFLLDETMIMNKSMRFRAAIIFSASILLWSIYAMMQSPTPYQMGLITGVLLGFSVGFSVGLLQFYTSDDWEYQATPSFWALWCLALTVGAMNTGALPELFEFPKFAYCELR